MSKLIKKSAEFIRVMNENDLSDKERQIRKDDYLRWLKGEKMTDDAKKLFVKDTVGKTSHLSQAKSIINNAKKDKNFYDTIDKEKQKELKPIVKESSIIKKITENVEAIVTATGQGGHESTSRYVGEDKKDIESQVIDGMDIDKENIHKIDIIGDSNEERGFKADVDSEGKDKKPLPIDNEPSVPVAPVGGEMMQTGITESRISYKQSIKEEEDLQRQTLVNGMENIRVKYAKGIADSIKLYSDLIPKARSQYSMNDLAVQLEHHIDEDTKELQDAIKNLSKKDIEELDRYQKSINESLEQPSEETPKQPNNIVGGKADEMSVEDIARKHNVSAEVIQIQIEKGIEIEMEHTDSEEKAVEIAMDHLSEFPDYYDRLDEMEKQAKADLKEKQKDAEVDLSNKLTKKEQKQINKEPSIDDKNELDPEKDNSEGTLDIMSKYMEGQIV